ncbi:hypothetical protein OIU76_024122, partial [Salix suchowensis]
MFAKAPPCRFCTRIKLWREACRNDTTRSFCTRTKLWREASSHITFIACGPCLLSVNFPPSRVAALGKVALE